MKFRSLEAFRGIAALMVALFHSTFYLESPNPLVLHSDLFVDFFFVLSGFVMTYAYQDRIGSSVHFRQFVILRFGRLYPLHLFTLLVWVPYILGKAYIYQKGIGSTDPLAASNTSTFLLNLAFLQSLAPTGGAGWNWPSWSVALEFYTYLVFYAFIIFSRCNRSIIIPALISVSAFVALYYSGPLLEIGPHSFFRCLGGFFCGIFIYRLTTLDPKLPTSKAAASTAEIITVSLMIAAISCYNLNPGLLFALSIVSFALVIIVFSAQEQGIISQLLHHKFPQYLGKLSYSIYLTHGLVMAAASNVLIYVFKFEKQTFGPVNNAVFFNESIFINTLLIGVVILCSAITYRFVETPWRDRSRAFSRKFQQ